MKKKILAVSLLLSSLGAFGSGYQLNLQGLRQLAMGGAGTGWVWDASTIFYNPAGLSELKNIQVYANLILAIPTTSYSSNTVYNSNYTTKTQVFTPFNLYVGGTIKKDSKIGVGIGIYTPFGSGIAWPDDWTGRYMVQSVQMLCVFVQPTVSYRVDSHLSVGAGFIYGFGNLDYKVALPLQNEQGMDGQAHLHGNISGVGFNAGVHYKFSDKLQVGVTYRSQVNMKMNSGTATFTVPASVEPLFPNTSATNTIPTPQVASLGIGYKPIDRLTLLLDLNYEGWNAFDSLKFDFSQHTSALQNIAQPRHYQNTVTVRVGGCYKINKKVSVMAGVAYDPTPSTAGFLSPDLPDGNRILLNCGFSYKPSPRVTILAAFEGDMTNKHFSTYNFENFSGKYQTVAAVPGIGITYNL